jgi:drug/metabolite transporter (DMT)-like permease
VLSKKWQTAATDPFGAIAWQMIFAGIANLIFALLVEKPSNVTWTFRGVAAILYLVVCGSWIGYTAYIWLLQHVPTSKVSTYAYVNPVVAVFLGWLVLHERIDRYIAGQRDHRGVGGAGDQRQGLDSGAILPRHR